MVTSQNADPWKLGESHRIKVHFNDTMRSFSGPKASRRLCEDVSHAARTKEIRLQTSSQCNKLKVDHLLTRQTAEVWSPEQPLYKSFPKQVFTEASIQEVSVNKQKDSPGKAKKEDANEQGDSSGRPSSCAYIHSTGHFQRSRLKTKTNISALLGDGTTLERNDGSTVKAAATHPPSGARRGTWP